MPNPCLSLSRSLEHVVTVFFRWHARHIANRPYLALVLSFFIAVIFSAGLANFSPENRPDKLWIPQDTVAQDDFDRVTTAFGDPFRRVHWVSLTKGGFSTSADKSLNVHGANLDNDNNDNVNGEEDDHENSVTALETRANSDGALSNVLTKVGILDVMTSYEAILAVAATESIESSGAETPWTIENLCARRAPTLPCRSVSVLDVFDYDRAKIEALADDQAAVDAVNAAINAKKEARIGMPLTVSDIMGSVEKDAEGNVVSALAFATTVIIDAMDRVRVEDGTRIDRPARAWEKLVNDEVFNNDGPANVGSTILEHRVFTERSAGDEFGDLIRDDITLVIIGMLLIVGFTAIVLGKPFSAVESRIMLAWGAVFSVGLAVAAAFGLASALGLVYSPFHSTLILLLLGLGVDDAFIIVAGFDSASKWTISGTSGKPVRVPIVDRISHGVAYAGSAVLVTSLTDAIAFAVGSNTELPALRSFALFASLGVVFDFFFQLTFFVACLTLDARRQEQGRADVAPCIVIRDKKTGKAKNVSDEPNTEGLLRYTIRTQYAPRLLTRTGAVVSIFIWFALLGLSIYGTTTLDTEFKIEDFVKDGSRLSGYYDAVEDHFQLDSDTRPAIFFEGEFDYVGNAAKVLALPGVMESSKWVVDGSISSWFDDFYASTGLQSPADMATDPRYATAELFGAEVAAFVATTAGGSHASDIIFATAPSTAVKSSRIYFKHIPLPSAQDKIDGMLDARDKLEEAGLPVANGDPEATVSTGTGAFVFTAEYLYFEQFRTIKREALLNVSLTVGAIAVISFLLIGHPIASLYVVIMVCWSVTVMFGLGGLWGISIDAVTMITSIVSIGILYDAIAHCAHAFVLSTGTKKDRALKSLTVMGSAVLYGVFSTFLAIVLLAASQSMVFRVFFKLLFLALLSGSYCALVVLPILLWLIGPSGGMDVEGDIDRSYKSMQVENVPWPWKPRQVPVHGIMASKEANSKTKTRGGDGVFVDDDDENVEYYYTTDADSYDDDYDYTDDDYSTEYV